MSARATIVLTVGIAIAKAMVNDWLGPGMVAQISEELLDVAKEGRARGGDD